MKTFALAAVIAMTTGAAFAGGHENPSTFQQTCSIIGFTWIGTEAGIAAVCLTPDGTPNDTSIVLPGIANINGELTKVDGRSSFQESCGNITVGVTPGSASILAFCRNSAGESVETDIEIHGLANEDGSLTFN